MLKAAYELKESFFDIHRCQTRYQALLAYAAWRHGNKDKGKTMVCFMLVTDRTEPLQGGGYGAAISTLWRLLEQGRF